MDRIAFAAIIFVVLAIFKELIDSVSPNWANEGPIGSVISEIILQIPEQVAISWLVFSVGLSCLGSFVVTPAFVGALGAVIVSLLVACFFCVSTREAPVTECSHGGGA
jgi:hypothetical protein